MTHDDLVHIAHRWLLNSAGCGVAFKELKCLGWETPDAIGFGGKVASILIECKVSRSDFFADRKKPFRLNPELGMGTHRIFCAPEGLLKLEELPERWALLSVNPAGRTKLTFRPNPDWPGAGFLTVWHHQPCDQKAERDIMYSALRRLQQAGHVNGLYTRQPALNTALHE